VLGRPAQAERTFLAIAVSISALAAMGDDDQLELSVRRGIDGGLTQSQINEALTHLGFYAGCGKATKALAVVNDTTGN
jgi:4-carboxymuconolactone decarboxylase